MSAPIKSRTPLEGAGFCLQMSTETPGGLLLNALSGQAFLPVRPTEPAARPLYQRPRGADFQSKQRTGDEGAESATKAAGKNAGRDSRSAGLGVWKPLSRAMQAVLGAIRDEADEQGRCTATVAETAQRVQGVSPCRAVLRLCPSIPMKSGQKSIAVAGNLGEVKWLKLRSKSRLWQECTPKRR